MTDKDKAMCPGNVGQRSVDIFAPGTPIWGTVRDGAFHNSQKMGGTSAAAAIVAGVAALVENVDPDADPALVKDTLMRSVGDTRTPGLIPVSVSGGRVNAARAVDARGTPPLSPNGPGGPWVTCDPDHDGDVLNLDICPDLYGRGTLDGCPDADADGVNDSRDNCTSTPTSPRPTTTAIASATPAIPRPAARTQTATARRTSTMRARRSTVRWPTAAPS